MNLLPTLVVPASAAALVGSAYLAAAGFPFVSNQRRRGFPVSNLFYFWATLASFLIVSAVGFLTNPYTVWGLPPVGALVGLTMLFIVSVRTDFTIHKIPKEPCWIVFWFGVIAFVSALLTGLVVLDVPQIATAGMLAIFPLSAFLSAMFGAGGGADFRVALASFAVTFWWVDFSSIAWGLLAFIILALVGRFFFPYKTPKGKKMAPAGPAYIAVFLVPAFVTYAQVPLF